MILNLDTVDIADTLKKHPTKKYKTRDLDKVNRVVIHCLDRDWTVDQLVNYDVDGKLTYWKTLDKVNVMGQPIIIKTTEYNHISRNGLPGITYHELIDKAGIHYHTLPHYEVSWHAAGYNRSSVAIGLMYRVTDTETKRDTQAPSEQMVRKLYKVAAFLCLQYYLTPDRVVGHRELKGTGFIESATGRKRLLKTCPGLKLDLDEVRYTVSGYMQLVLKEHGFYDGIIDCDFGPKSKKALKDFKNGN